MPTHLLLQGSTPWVLNGFYTPPEAGLHELTKLGASTIEISDFIITDEMLELVAAQNLRLIIQAYPEAADDIEPALALARRTRAIAINCHVRTPHLTHEESAELARALIQRGADAGIPLYFETHRGCITQDLYRTSRLVEAVPDMRFTLDVSHYVVCEEVPGPVARLAPLLDPILDRVEMIHGRVSNGQQIQVPAVQATGELEQGYIAFWTEAMRRWRMRKPAGSSLIFTPELGPPPYAVLTPEGKEVSNRLEQSANIWQMAQTAWKNSATATSPVWPLA